MNTTKRPRSVDFRNGPLTCTMCKNDRFYKDQVKIDNMIAQIMNLHRPRPFANCYICSKCKHEHWMLD